MTHEEIVKALNSLVPGAEWELHGDDYSEIIWFKGEKPTLEQLESELKIIPIKEAAKLEDLKSEKDAILQKLGITEDEAKLLLS